MHIGTGNQGPEQVKVDVVLDKPDRVVPPHLITSNLVRQCL